MYISMTSGNDILLPKTEKEKIIAANKNGIKKTAAAITDKITITFHGTDEDRPEELAVEIDNDEGYMLYMSQTSSPETIGNVIKQIAEKYVQQQSPTRTNVIPTSVPTDAPTNAPTDMSSIV
tara:strand:- start:328 stop:693 length:366 start_codon:yes stop_codon:yes gene_type:complete